VLDGAGTLLDAAIAFMREQERVQRLAHIPTVNEAINLYLNVKRAEETRGEISRLTLYEIESKMRIVREAFGERKVTEIDEAAVSAFIRNLPHAARGKANIRTKLSQFLNYCRREGNWITVNPTENIKVRVRNGEEVKILTVPEVRQLLAAAQSCELPASVIAYLAVQLFAGLRPFEAAQLRWERIHFETHQIEVLGTTSKTRETRFVQMEPLLAAWLLPFRAQTGRITGPFFAETLRAVKVSAGFTFGDDNSTNPWPKDVLRHCYGSYWLAVHKDRAHLAELMGTSLAMIKTHYKRAIPQPQAEAFWKLEPMPEAPGKIIPMDNVMDSVNEFPTLKFRFAKTMAHIPHFYVVRSAENNAEYEALFHRIAQEGVWEEWKDGRQYKYLSLGAYRYWTMTEDITQSKVINRARAS
jgi:integrase